MLGSIFNLIRFIFSRWSHQIAIAKREVTNTASSTVLRKRKMGVATALPKAATEDFFDIMARHNQVIQIMMPINRLVPKITPIKVATPFPPLN